MSAKKNTLGKGLSSLIKESGYLYSNSKIRDIDLIDQESENIKGKNFVIDIQLSQIKARENQPRKHFNEEKIFELSESITAQGLLSPILLRSLESDSSENDLCYEIIAGERRFRACSLLNWTMIPAIVLDKSAEDVMLISITENIQRENLNPIEEALSYKSLLDKYNYTQEILAKKLGKSRSFLTNSIRLLNLDNVAIDALIAQDISVGHAKIILSTEPKYHAQITKYIIHHRLSVRETEEHIKNIGFLQHNSSSKSSELQAINKSSTSKEVISLQKSYQLLLKDKFNLKSKFKNSSDSMSLTITFNKNDDFSTILDKLIK